MNSIITIFIASSFILSINLAKKIKTTGYSIFIFLITFLDPVFILFIIKFYQFANYFILFHIVSLLFVVAQKGKKFFLLALIISFLISPYINKSVVFISFITVIDLALILNFFIERVINQFKNSGQVPYFDLLLIGIIIKDCTKYFLFFDTPALVVNNYILFLAIGFILSLLILIIGPVRTLKFEKYIRRLDKLTDQSIDSIISVNENPGIKFFAYDPINELTHAEIRVLELLGEGYKSKEIAEKLFICPKTVYFHCSNVKEKLNINSINGLTKFAIENRQKLQKTNNTGKITNRKI